MEKRRRRCGPARTASAATAKHPANRVAWLALSSEALAVLNPAADESESAWDRASQWIARDSHEAAGDLCLVANEQGYRGMIKNQQRAKGQGNGGRQEKGEARADGGELKSNGNEHA